jgi:hypothetical protein
MIHDVAFFTLSVQILVARENKYCLSMGQIYKNQRELRNTMLQEDLQQQQQQQSYLEWYSVVAKVCP